jgi:hypothetical protein
MTRAARLLDVVHNQPEGAIRMEGRGCVSCWNRYYTSVSAVAVDLQDRPVWFCLIDVAICA